MTDPRAGLFLCEHWRCWLSPRACAARHRAANRKPRWGPSSMNGDYTPALCGNYCGRCEIGRENARREDEMKKAKKSVVPEATWENPAVWRDLLGEPLAGKFFEVAGENHPLDHLRHVVAEYYYLRELPESGICHQVLAFVRAATEGRVSALAESFPVVRAVADLWHEKRCLEMRLEDCRLDAEGLEQFA